MTEDVVIVNHCDAGSASDERVHRLARPHLSKKYFSTDRMQLFTDALFSIIATIMVIPLVKVSEEYTDQMKDGELHLWKYLWEEKMISIVVFIFTFLLLTLYQYRHANIFNLVEQELTYRENAQLASINALLVLFLCVYPWAAALLAVQEGNKDKVNKAYLWPYPGLVVMVSIMYLVLQRKLLVGKVTTTELRFRVSGPIFEIIGALAMLVLSLILPEDRAIWSTWAGLVIPVLYVVRARVMRSVNPSLISKFRGAVVETERLHTFADGVFAIASTLLVLEISPPTSSDNASEYFNEIYPDILAFVPTFLLTLGIWTGHYMVGHHLRAANIPTCIMNSVFLVFVAILPVTFSLFVKTKTKASQTLVMIVLTLTGVLQVIMLCYNRYANNGANFAFYEGVDHRFPFIIMRLLIVPVLACLVMISSLFFGLNGFYLLYLSPSGLILSSSLEARSERKHLRAARAMTTSNDPKASLLDNEIRSE